MKTLQIITLGCSKNTVDTEHLLYQVRSEYSALPPDYDGRVDVLLVNTCGFIQDAKEESIGVILREAQRKKDGLIGRLYVFGCLSQRYPSEMKELIPEVDGWFGARGLEPVVRALGCTPDPSSAHRRVITGGSLPYAFLKISEGCDRRCSYCAIPLIRGPHRSVPMETLLEEARELSRSGIREIVVIAQDTTMYGVDIYRRQALAELLRRLSEVEGIEWIRLHYSYPESFPEDVLDEMASNPRICRYIDIPLQHISDGVLANMHRHVTGDQTRALVRKMREKVPGVVLRTTMIVGHPGEGPAEFRELRDFVSEARFERLGAFTYSEEEGTWGALNLRDSVSPATKKRRLDSLMELQGGISEAFNASRVGTREKVLVDEYNAGYLICRSEFESPEVDGEIIVRYSPEVFEGVEPYSLVGEFINVKITAADRYDLVAEPIPGSVYGN